jgi:hypothetical protein
LASIQVCCRKAFYARIYERAFAFHSPRAHSVSPASGGGRVLRTLVGVATTKQRDHVAASGLDSQAVT